ncbi:formate/nitrite transporter family protein [Paenibacillus tarimensis]|uniref:formate/nitrite transporter family protein n=1 Tax=Paenibacillus tarimensis TaxID=416012 RepID=UPI001F32A305|nr:formate/nitrite transporter family protein [Paenibacillus tarimensis]MCF2946280.1 formate/nitrite transporter family protein [Paenibacillus tarimensis]
MFKETVQAAIEKAVDKKELLDSSRARYLLAAGLAAVYVGFGIILIFTIGAPLAAAGSPLTPMLMGMSFGIALTLVVFAGAELFTGNNMYFAIALLSGKTTWKDTLRNWLYCYLGNLVGALFFCLLIAGTGLFAHVGQDNLLFAAAAMKMNLSYYEAFFRGVLCNWLVCLSLWTSMRAKEDTAKLILIFWMLFAFIASGYEHSVANMTVLSLALLLPHPDTITIAGWFHNMIPVTLGNIVGGAFFVGTIYWLISPVKSRHIKAKKQEQAAETGEPVSAAIPAGNH